MNNFDDTKNPVYPKLRYEECYAKFILEEFFPERYNEITVSDKPDLKAFETNIGIEVTQAISQEILNRIAYSEHDDETSNDSALTQYLKASILKPHATSTRDEQVPPVLYTIDRKLQKLNKGLYGNFKNYDLFIYTELCDEVYPFLTLSNTLKKENSYSKRYSYIYVYNIKDLYVFDIDNGNIDIIPCDLSKRIKLDSLAQDYIQNQKAPL